MLNKFSDFYIGQIATFKKVFEEKDFKLFEQLSGDSNSLHWDKKYAKKSSFKKIIVPLQLTTAPLSKVAGMIFPGEPSLFLSNNVKAIKPVFYSEEITYSARIEKISQSTKLLGIRVLAIRGKEIVIDAFIEVKVICEEWDQKKAIGVKHLSLKKSDQKLLITGATGEIGRATCVKLAREGFRLIIIYRNNDEKIKTLQEELNKINKSHEYIRADLNEINFKEKLKIAFKSIDLSNGISGFIHIASPPVEDKLENLVKINYTSLIEIIDTIIPFMLLRHKASIIFLSSIAVLRHIDGWQDYIAAKTMATSFLSGINLKFSNYGLNCASIMPGLVQTNYSKKYRNNDVSLLPGEIAEEICKLLDEKPPELIKLEPNQRQTGNYIGGFVFNAPSTDSSIKNNPQKSVDNKSLNEDLSIRNKLNSIFFNVIKIEEENCGENLSIETNANWDSLSHFQLIAAIENEFSIKFNSNEISILTNYVSLLKTISEKCLD